MIFHGNLQSFKIEKIKISNILSISLKLFRQARIVYIFHRNKVH